MASTGDPLARRYRRLLCCYPRAYRRERGDELVALLLDTAPPGRTRPRLREAVDLIRNGMRCRLGRPASSTVVAWAALVAIVCGLFSAALSARVAWETARPLPGRAETGAIFRTVLADREPDEITTPSSFFGYYTQPLTLQALDNLLLGDGGEYQQTATGAWAAGPPPAPPGQTAAVAQRRLREAGWHLDQSAAETFDDCADKLCGSFVPVTYTTLDASRGDTLLTVTVNSRPEPDYPYLSIDLRRTTPPLVLPAAIGGGLLGALASWLVFGWASRRTETPHPARAVVKVLFGVTLLLWWLPIVVAVPSVASHHGAEQHPQWHPFWEWLGQPTFSLFFLVGSVSALLGIALATLPRRDADRISTLVGG
ncbi:hypothetical protein ABT214_09825 [Micromonospora purpureochromogenes]|uniref:hypothetical protein n=1 Tax=Micromonospora purpureochromogenes TaxID=47872 RepID=UPI00331A24C6